MFVDDDKNEHRGLVLGRSLQNVHEVQLTKFSYWPKFLQGYARNILSLWLAPSEGGTMPV